MISSGMLINDRYEIIERIGSGGMADVFKANDTRLNRLVAVKILKQEFSNDKNFITRFKNEAQSAACLSHPNIVSVYDVGDDNGYHYIVMELVEGITLKKFIEKKGRLEVREAVGISIQIAQGMEAAHDNHIIHRDIKPQNIMISRDGKVKVADFGIAKVVSTNTFTQTTVGTVHYLSPEQARGGYSDERSDIYSLGVTLYEMLTGELPFGGDSDVTVALAHIQNEARPAREIVPSIPYSLDRVVQKCMQKHPENRYNSASDLIMDLKHSITNPDGDFVVIDDGSSFIGKGTKTFNKAEFEEIKTKAEKGEKEAVQKSKAMSREDSKILREELEELDTIDSKWEKAITILSVLFVIAVCGALVYVVVRFLGLNEKDPGTDPSSLITTRPPSPTAVAATATPEPTSPLTIPMPKLLGYTVEDAQRVMAAYSKDIVVLEAGEDFSNEPVGIIIKQYPPEGSDVLPDAEIKVIISSGSKPMEVPRVIGLSQSAATSAIEANGFVVSPVFESSDIVEAGKVIRTEPSQGESLPAGEVVSLIISSGPPITYTEVPNLIGKTTVAAEAELLDRGLVLGAVEEDYSDLFTEGLVIHQSVDATKTVFSGETVNITVSKGPYPEGYIPTPTPTPIPSPEPGEQGYNPDGSIAGQTGRRYFIANYDTSDMIIDIDVVDGTWFTFEIVQDGIVYPVVMDYSNGMMEELVSSQERVAEGFSFRLFTDYGEYSTLHAGMATITAYRDTQPLESQIITLEEFTE